MYDKNIFTDGSVRTLLAKQEHQRWNANYICSGVIPCKKSQIDEKGSGKDMEARLIHHNLTTFEGLEEYRLKAVESMKEKDCYAKEVRHYDYRIMDAIDLIMADVNIKIIDKEVKESQSDNL